MTATRNEKNVAYITVTPKISGMDELENQVEKVNSIMEQLDGALEELGKLKVTVEVVPSLG